jgi:hypothetical protein
MQPSLRRKSGLLTDFEALIINLSVDVLPNPPPPPGKKHISAMSFLGSFMYYSTSVHTVSWGSLFLGYMLAGVGGKTTE